MVANRVQKIAGRRGGGVEISPIGENPTFFLRIRSLLATNYLNISLLCIAMYTCSKPMPDLDCSIIPNPYLYVIHISYVHNIYI